MATGHSTGLVPAFLPVSLSIPIRPAIIRGRLYFEVGPVLFPTFAQAATAWSAAEAHRLDIAGPIDELISQRTEALADMRHSARDLVAFAAACEHEAELAAQIRQLRWQGGAR